VRPAVYLLYTSVASDPGADIGSYVMATAIEHALAQTRFRQSGSKLPPSLLSISGLFPFLYFASFILVFFLYFLLRFMPRSRVHGSVNPRISLCSTHRTLFTE